MLSRAANAGLPVAPTIVISRAAWNALQEERKAHDDRLRVHWVATLFRLVGRNGRPPRWWCAPQALRHSTGLMPARPD